MRESFVFHLSFIENLPEDRRTEFINYAVNYGLFEEEPILDDMALAFWKTIKSRIDTDKQQYCERMEKQNEARKKYREKIKGISEISKISKISEINGNICPNSHSEYEFDNEFVSEYEFDIDNVSVSDANITPAQKEYSKAVFKLWNEAGLPGSKDEFSFRAKEFYQSLPALKGLHSNDVLQAIDNYISVLKDKSCYLKKKYCFDSFVSSKIFKEMLPDRFVKGNFKRFDTSSAISNDTDSSDYSFSKVAANGK